jgi:hypothetical protein
MNVVVVEEWTFLKYINLIIGILKGGGWGWKQKSKENC